MGCTDPGHSPELRPGERAQGEHAFMTLLINSAPAVKHHVQTDNRNEYLTVLQTLPTRMEFTLKDTVDLGEGFNGIFEI